MYENRLRELREQLGMKSQVAFCRASGALQQQYWQLESGRESPRCAKSGEWTKIALRVAAFHGVSPDEIWPNELLEDPAGLLRARPGLPPADQLMAQDALLERTQTVLDSLSARERYVIELRFGIRQPDSASLTYEQVADVFGRTRERIRQVEAKALRKLRHPSRSMKLYEFVSDFDLRWVRPLDYWETAQVATRRRQVDGPAVWTHTSEPYGDWRWAERYATVVVVESADGFIWLDDCDGKRTRVRGSFDDGLEIAKILVKQRTLEMQEKQLQAEQARVTQQAKLRLQMQFPVRVRRHVHNIWLRQLQTPSLYEIEVQGSEDAPILCVGKGMALQKVQEIITHWKGESVGQMSSTWTPPEA